MFYLYDKIWLLPRTCVRPLGPCLLILHFAKQTSCQYKLSKKTSAIHYRGTIGIVVLESK